MVLLHVRVLRRRRGGGEGREARASPVRAVVARRRAIVRGRVAVVDAFGGTAPFLRKERAAREVGSRAFTIKATAHDDRRAYEKAKRIALKAREARREARIALADHGPEHPITREALHLREAAKRELVETGSLQTYARAAHERRARRPLGLIDERWPRLLCRLRLLELAQRSRRRHWAACRRRSSATSRRS